MDTRQRFRRRLILAVGVTLAAIGASGRAQVGGLELLPLSEAFRLEVSRPQPERLRISWTIADGYYMYRQRFRFEAAPAGVLAGFDLPPGIVKQDPFFGETEIYRHRIAFELPLEGSAAEIARIKLRVISQGCADIGICFPPEERHVSLAVGEAARPEASDSFSATGGGVPADLFSPLVPARPGPPPAALTP